MKKQLFIYHHLGLGDHIICNGLVRNIVKDYGYEEYFLFCKQQNAATVSFMFRDLKNLKIVAVISDHNITPLLQMGLPILRIGFEHVKDSFFDREFYRQLNIPFEKRWDDFYVERELEKEKDLFNKFNVKEGEYIFIHDDYSRLFLIEENHVVNKHLPAVRPQPGLTDNSFDYCYLIEHSKEAHFIDSSFRLLMDSLQLKNDNIYLHINLKGGIIKDPNFTAKLKLNFKIL
jgi:hypothetical protein